MTNKTIDHIIALANAIAAEAENAADCNSLVLAQVERNLASVQRALYVGIRRARMTDPPGPGGLPQL